MRRALVIATLAVAALLGGTGSAHARAAVEPELTAVELQFKAGEFVFELSKDDENADEKVQLVVRGRRQAVFYQVDGEVSRKGVEAKFGTLGEVAFRFTPTQTISERRPPPGCKGKVSKVLEGVYSGTFDFRGERGYAEAETSRVPGEMRITRPWDCPPRRSALQRRAVGQRAAGRGGEDVAVLSAGRRDRRLVFAALAFRYTRAPRSTSFTAVAFESREGMLIYRYAYAGARASAFRFNLRKGTAVVRPPWPFQGGACSAVARTGTTPGPGRCACSCSAPTPSTSPLPDSGQGSPTNTSTSEAADRDPSAAIRPPGHLGTVRRVSLNGQVVVATDVTRRYGEGDAAVDALAGVSTGFDRDRFTAIMGPSGSGKSTLMHILAGLDKPTSGSVELDGVEITRLDDSELTELRRDKLGFVFQFFNLLPVLTAEENLVLPLSIAGRKPDQAWVEQLIDAVGLADRRTHRPSELSGGQQQRVAVARALVSKPAVVFADEPTGNLDSKASADVLGLLRRAVDEFDQTVVMVTHDPIAAAHADRLITLQDGRLVHAAAPGSADDVIELMKQLD